MSGQQERIGDAERDAALSALGAHFAAGRLSHEEYDERADAVWTARTRGDLDPMFADLPAPPSPQGEAPWRPRRAGWPVPFVPVLVALIVLSAVTHFPFVLLGLFGWLLLRRRARVFR